MADNQRHRIKNLLQKLNDEDRNSLCCLLVKAGYAVRIGKERPGGKGQTMYFVEYWVEGDDTKCNIYGKEWIFKRRNQNLYREGISL